MSFSGAEQMFVLDAGLAAVADCSAGVGMVVGVVVVGVVGVVVVGELVVVVVVVGAVLRCQFRDANH